MHIIYSSQYACLAMPTGAINSYKYYVMIAYGIAMYMQLIH